MCCSHSAVSHRCIQIAILPNLVTNPNNICPIVIENIIQLSGVGLSQRYIKNYWSVTRRHSKSPMPCSWEQQSHQGEQQSYPGDTWAYSHEYLLKTITSNDDQALLRISWRERVFFCTRSGTISNSFMCFCWWVHSHHLQLSGGNWPWTHHRISHETCADGSSFGACLSTRSSGIDDQESVGGLCMDVLSNIQWLLKVLGPYRQRLDIQFT